VTIVEMLVDEYTRAEIAASGLREAINIVGELPTVERIEVFPDIAKKSWGFPSGTRVTTNGVDPFLYPMAVPDMACGYNVIATGLDASGWTRDDLRRILGQIAETVGAGSSTRVPFDGDVNALLSSGLDGLPLPERYTYESARPEQQALDDGNLDLLDDACRNALAGELGSVAGHFLAVYTVESIMSSGPAASPSTGEVILVVHTGAPALRDQIYRTHIVPMAELAIEYRLMTDMQIGSGLFGVPLSHGLAREFLHLCRLSWNFGYANRHLVAERVLKVLFDNAKRGQGMGVPRLLRHVGHCGFSVPAGTNGDKYVVSQRGIQPLTWSAGLAYDRPERPLTFITGNHYTQGYLVIDTGEGEEAHYCGHGTPTWTPVHRPGHLVESPWTALDPALQRALAMYANSRIGSQELARDLANIEGSIHSMSVTGMARPVARLLPLLNYREARYA
jgi:RNA-splicing ligase RtcB